MTSKRFNIVMMAALGLIVAGGAGLVYKGNGYLEQRALALKELKLSTLEREDQVKAYQQAKAEVEKYQSLKSIIDRAIPSNKDQARIILEINNIAKQSGITIQSIKFPASQLGTATPKVAAPAAPAPASGSTAPSASAAPATPVAAIITQTQVTPVEGLTGVGAIATEVTPLIDKSHPVRYDQMIDFLERLETDQRTMQVADLQLNPSSKGKADSISFTLKLNIFVRQEGVKK